MTKFIVQMGKTIISPPLDNYQMANIFKSRFVGPLIQELTISVYTDCSWLEREQNRCTERYKMFSIPNDMFPEINLRHEDNLVTRYDYGYPYLTSIRTIMRHYHFVHLSEKQGNKIAYTKSAENGMKDLQTVTTLGRYLNQYFSDQLNAERIESIANWFREMYMGDGPPLKLAKTPDEMESVYMLDAEFCSCMQHGLHKFESHVHPVRAYGAGDLELAYIVGVNGKLKTRALIWQKPEKRTIVGRVYGDSALMRDALLSIGIQTESNVHDYDSLEGARLLKIESHCGNYVLPYLDDPMSVTDDGEFFLADDCGEISTESEYGIAHDPETSFHCYYCENRRHTDGMVIVNDESWCEDCSDNYSFYCENTERSYSTNSCDAIEVRVGSHFSETWCSDYCGSEYFYCDQTNIYYSFNYFDSVIMVDGNTVELSWFENNGFTCSITDSLYHNDDMVTYDDEYVAKENLPDDAIEESPGIYTSTQMELAI